MTNERFAYAIMVARTPGVLEEALRHFREWWPKRHGHWLDAGKGEKFWTSTPEFSRNALRDSIQWIRFCKAARDLEEPWVTYYKQESEGLPECRWEDDGGSVHE